MTVVAVTVGVHVWIAGHGGVQQTSSGFCLYHSDFEAWPLRFVDVGGPDDSGL